MINLHELPAGQKYSGQKDAGRQRRNSLRSSVFQVRLPSGLHPFSGCRGQNPGLWAGVFNLRPALNGGVSNRSWFYARILRITRKKLSASHKNISTFAL
jgi:hypothetical protein